MKKAFLLFTLISSLFLISINIRANTWRYEWINTYVNVPVYASLNAYDDLPKASLYKDGVYLSDASISYNRNGDWLYYYQDVNTNIPGDYRVWYKAIESKYRPGTCANYKQLITFHVYDNIFPQINILKEDIYLPLNNKDIDYTEYFTVRDNFPDYKVFVDSDAVNYKEEGDYEVLITAIDTSNNTSYAKLYVHIKDSLGPVITFLGENDLIEVEKGSVEDQKEFFSSYFKAIDAVDGNVLNSISYPEIDLNKTWENKIRFTFKDNSGNESTKDIIVRVVDKLPPTIILTTDNLKLDYKTEPSYELFAQYIKEAYDGLVDLSLEVKIDYSEINLEVGTYNVYYYLIDTEGNETTKVLQVNYITDKAPEIKTSDIKINVGEDVNFIDYIQVTDDSDPNVEKNIKIDTSKYNNKKAGIYYLNVTCFNSSGLYNNAYIKVEVIDNGLKINNILNYLLIGILIVLFTSFLVYFLIKRKKNKKTILS